MGSPQMTLSGNVRAAMSVTALKNFDMATGSVALSSNWSLTVDSAAAGMTSDVLWQSDGTLAASASTTIDLAGTAAGDPKDYWGADAEFDRVHAVLVKNTTAAAAPGESIIEVGGGSDGAGTSAFVWLFGGAADTLKLAPGGFVVSSHGQDGGWGVTDSSADVLRLVNLDASNAATYEIVVIGESPTSASTTTTTSAP